MTKLYIIRHTQTVGNVEKRLTGRSDYELTETGKIYVDKLTDRLKDVKFDKAYASLSGRTIKTIMPLAKLNGLDIEPTEDLCEMNFGIYDGWNWKDVNEINPEIDRLHKETNEIKGIPEQETTEEVTKRMCCVMQKIAKENDGKTVLICSHGVAIEAFLRSITGVPFTEQIEEYSQKNTTVNIVEYDKKEKRFALKLLNDVSHLEES